MKYHPDTTKEPKAVAETNFAKINQAYEVLGNEEKRQMYDQYGEASFGDGMEGGPGGFGGGGGGGGGSVPDLEELLRQFGFGGGMEMNDFGFGNASSEGDDCQVSMAISFMESINGAKKDVSFTADSKCGSCSGSGDGPNSKRTKCSSCNGKGQVGSPIKMKISRPNSSFQKKKKLIITETLQTFIRKGIISFSAPCGKCKGKGTVSTNQCSPCSGSGVKRSRKVVGVPIPAGVEDGAVLRMANEGNAGQNGSRNGNLFIKINVSPHQYFKREGNNIHLEVPLTLSQAALGCTLTIPTLSGDTEIIVNIFSLSLS